MKKLHAFFKKMRIKVVVPQSFDAASFRLNGGRTFPSNIRDCSVFFRAIRTRRGNCAWFSSKYFFVRGTAI